MHVFPFRANFQSRWNSGGSAASPAAAFLASWEEESVRAAAATDFSGVVATAFVERPGALATGAFGCTTIVQADNGGLAGAATGFLDASNFKCMGKLSGKATIVLGDNGGRAVAATDLHDATNSKGAFREIEVEGILPAEGHGEATSVRGDSGSTAFSLPMDSLIRGSPSDSLHYHPIHACARSCLASDFVGLGLGAGVGVCAGVSCVVSLGVVDDEDDACMDGLVTDAIHSASNSVNQGFSEYHDDSCTRLNALLNSRMRHAHVGRGKQSC